MANKYRNIRIIRGSQFRLEEAQSMTPEEVMALPEAAAMEAEEAQTQGAVAATIEEEELESLSSEIP